MLTMLVRPVVSNCGLDVESVYPGRIRSALPASGSKIFQEIL